MKQMKKYREDFTQLKQNYQETPKKQFHTINPLQKVLEQLIALPVFPTVVHGQPSKSIPNLQNIFVKKREAH